MKTISILLLAFILSSVSEAQGEPDDLSTAYDNAAKNVADYKAGKENPSNTGLYRAASLTSSSLDDGAFEHCSVLIGYFSGLPMWRDTGIPMTRVENTLDHIITEDPTVTFKPMTQSELDKYNRAGNTKVTMDEWNEYVKSEKSGLGAWRSAVASTPQDMDDWNAAIKSIYSSRITEKQIDSALRKYCIPHTKHVFSASDLSSLLSKSQKSNQSSSAISPSPLSQRQCAQLGGVYAATASARNQGETPNEALNYIGSLYPINPDFTNERLVLMPVKLSVEDKELQTDVDSVLLEELKQKYEVISGSSVAKRTHEIILKMPKENEASDRTPIFRAIAESFHSALIAKADVSKEIDGYYWNLSIENISNNSVLFAQGTGCSNCDANQAVQQIKLMANDASQSKKGAENLQLSEKQVKRIINQVYFAPAFRSAGGTALQMQIYQACMGTYRPMEPLK